MKWIKTYERWIYVGLIVIGAAIWIIQQQEDTPVQPLPLEQVEQEEQQEQQMEEQAPVIVDVKGAVKRAGVYEVAPESRIHDVIQLAGGLTDEADETKVNLAMKVHDEMVIYVPKKGEDIIVETTSQTGSSSGKININTATIEQLQTLQGIGPAKAAAIIAYREEHGSFQKVEDLLNVSGIGSKSLEKIKEQIVVR
ncbi:MULTISPECIES: helix-hairpin-helix domain-containing protein [Anoxybacillus]|uniref:Competence protein ComEA n=1 Tax=Anoxybacillus flavithermus TaxID=33934 RepID=A0AAX2A1K7_9BACL|nr:helix-hairpin-helix domain-containing protein [Anoxybacillus flavithermus]ASA95403.1 competence protein ComEA [Anoxybacillus flavithermus]MBE2907460.1 competence protein ComEA [Anoxybacillus flavithermus]MBE2909953.1 competence protein ComEA [Anoxybacillus flavithermus]MBE2915705.1 competence protein ComEA [Anoxybacillus flavithermus]MBE2917846.1 competence protein ComEA [Anoxybacillus flavithermus]